MTQSSQIKRLLAVLCAFTAILCLWRLNTCAPCGAADRTVQPLQEQKAKPQAAAVDTPERPGVQPAAEPSTVVGRIGTYVITMQELQERLMTELYPRGGKSYYEQEPPPDAQTVLMKILADKAIVMEARKEGRLESELAQIATRRFTEGRLMNLLVKKHGESNRDRITATGDEIKQRMQAEQNLDEMGARAAVEQAKARTLLQAYYTQIYAKARVQKLDQNYGKVIEIYQRLLHHPKGDRQVKWIENSQVKNELAPQEANLPLALYIGGKVTLKDWLESYCGINPYQRPLIDTPRAVDELLERALHIPLFLWEAATLGLDKDPELLTQVRDYQDTRLLNEIRIGKQTEVAEPTPEEISAYYQKNRETFGTSKILTVDVIWCEDLPTAQKAKAELDTGKDFGAIRQQYGLERAAKVFNTYPASEGLFWKDLWAGEPGQILGPLKGFYSTRIKWRLVKIVEKTLGEEKPYSPEIELQIRNRIINERTNNLVNRYREALLKKYSFQTYPEKIRDVDLLNLP